MAAAPLIREAVDDVSPKSGVVFYGDYTNDSSPLIRVELGDQAEEGQSLSLSADRIALTASVAVTAADIARGYAELPTSGLPDGWNLLTATLRRPDGATVASSMAFALGVATTAPATPTITRADDDAGAQTGALVDGARTDDATPTFHIFEAGLPATPTGSPGHAPYGGVALFGGRIQLFEGGRLVGESNLGYDGQVTITPGELAPGEHVLTAVAVDRAGNVSAPSEPFSIVIGTDGGGGMSAPATSTNPTNGDDLLQAAAGFLKVHAGDGDDTILGVDADTVLRGGAGADSIVGGARFNDINGNQGDDSIVGRSTVGDWLLGGQGDDLIDAAQSSGRNIINGNLGADTITGGSGAEILRGGQGDDVLEGGAGDDWLSGDLGQNTVSGGDGADIFHAFQGAGVSRVLDFSFEEGDRVLLGPGSRHAVAQVGEDTVIDVGGQGRMILVNVDYASLDDGWILRS